MRNGCDEQHGSRGDRGFVLAVVLWVAGLLAVLAASFSLSVRSHVRVAANISESAAAEALAEGGVALAIADLVAARSEPSRHVRFAFGAAAVACAIRGQGTLRIALSDESARIDLNSAGLPILEALLAGLGEPPDRAVALAAAIADFRDGDDARRPNGAERAEYLAAGLAWTPKNAAFEAIEELDQVHGISPALIAKLRPFIGFRSGLAGIDARLATPELIALLRSGVERSGAGFAGLAERDPDYPLPAIFNTPAPRRSVALRVEAIRPAGARFVREAIVEVGQGQARLYRIAAWKQGGSSRDVIVPDGRIPDC